MEVSDMWEFSAPAWCDLTQVPPSTDASGRLLVEDGYFEPNRMENPGGFDWSPERARVLYGEPAATAVNVPLEEDLLNAVSGPEVEPQEGDMYGNAVMEELRDLLAPQAPAARTPALNRSHARSAQRTRSATGPRTASRSVTKPSPSDVALECALASDESDCSSLEVANAAPQLISIAVAQQQQSPARPRSVMHIASPAARRIPTPRSELRTRPVPVASPQPRSSGGGSSSRSLSLTLTDSSSKASAPSTSRKPAFTPVASRGRAIALAAAFTPSTLGSTPSSSWTRISSGSKLKRARLLLADTLVAAAASPAPSMSTGSTRTPVSVPSTTTTPAAAAAARLSDARSASHGTTPESSTHVGDAEDAITAFTEALELPLAMPLDAPASRDAVRASITTQAVAAVAPAPVSAAIKASAPALSAKGPLVSLRDVQPSLARRVISRKQGAVASIANAAIAKQAVSIVSGSTAPATAAQRVPVGAKPSLRQRLVAMAKPVAPALPKTQAPVHNAGITGMQPAAAPVVPALPRARAATPTQRTASKFSTPIAATHTPNAAVAVESSTKRARRVPVDAAPTRTAAQQPLAASATAADAAAPPARAASVTRRQSTPVAAHESMVTPVAATRGRRRSDSITRATGTMAGGHGVEGTPVSALHTPVQQPAYVSFAEVMARFNSGISHLDHTSMHATPRAHSMGPAQPPALPAGTPVAAASRTTQVTPFHLHTEQRAQRGRRSSSLEPSAVAQPTVAAKPAPTPTVASLGIAQKFMPSADGSLQPIRERVAPVAAASIASMGATGMVRVEKKAVTQGIAPSFVKDRPITAPDVIVAKEASAATVTATTTGLKSRLLRMRHGASAAAVAPGNSAKVMPAAAPSTAQAPGTTAIATVPVSPRLATKMRSLVKHGAAIAAESKATATVVKETPAAKARGRAALHASERVPVAAHGTSMTGI